MFLQVIALVAVSAACNEPEHTGCFSTAAKMPLGALDFPASGQPLHDTERLAGWAAAEGGIHEVLIYVDRNFITLATYGTPRADVAKAHPEIPGTAASGWSALLDTTQISPGPHRLTVQAQSKDGASRDLADITVVVRQR